ncbi:MAG: type II toxin-antitoxin system HicB family antitoxin [Steroidobacteraceae bacterium]
MQFTIAIQRHSSGYQIAAPDLPGCLAIGETLADARRQIKLAIHEHCERLAADGKPLPVPRPFSRWMGEPSFGSCGWNIVSSAVEYLFAPPLREFSLAS